MAPIVRAEQIEAILSTQPMKIIAHKYWSVFVHKVLVKKFEMSTSDEKFLSEVSGKKTEDVIESLVSQMESLRQQRDYLQVQVDEFNVLYRKSTRMHAVSEGETSHLTKFQFVNTFVAKLSRRVDSAMFYFQVVSTPFAFTHKKSQKPTEISGSSARYVVVFIRKGFNR